MKYFHIVLTFCLAVVVGHLSADTTRVTVTQDNKASYVFFTTPTAQGWVKLTANLHGNEVNFELPSFEEWSYNTREKRLEFVVSTKDYETLTGISVQHVPEDADWDDLVKENREWFCTCGGEECDCALVQLAYNEEILFAEGKIVRRIDEVVWDRDEVRDSKTGASTLEGPICKTTMILDGRQFFLVMTRYKGSEKERRRDLEVIHDEIADSISKAYEKEFALIAIQ